MDRLGRSAIIVGGATVLSGVVQGEIQIVPDETTNCLLIRAQPADYETIRQAIDVLDLRPLQVFIEVLIAEVKRTRSLDVGVTGSVVTIADGNQTAAVVTSTTPDNVMPRINRGTGLSVLVAIL